MKKIIYQLPGDPIEVAHYVIACGIFQAINNLEIAERTLLRFIPNAEIITFCDFSREEFEAMAADTILIP